MQRDRKFTAVTEWQIDEKKICTVSFTIGWSCDNLPTRWGTKTMIWKKTTNFITSMCGALVCITRRGRANGWFCWWKAFPGYICLKKINKNIKRLTRQMRTLFKWRSPSPCICWQNKKLLFYSTNPMVLWKYQYGIKNCLAGTITKQEVETCIKRNLMFWTSIVVYITDMNK